jgi:hypothetical protein
MKDEQAEAQKVYLGLTLRLFWAFGSLGQPKPQGVKAKATWAPNQHRSVSTATTLTRDQESTRLDKGHERTS